MYVTPSKSGLGSSNPDSTYRVTRYIKKNAQKQLKQNDKKLKLELLKKGLLNSKKICTLRSFSHLVAQHLLPGGGHDRALH